MNIKEWWGNLSLSDTITLIAMIITILSMIVSVYQARKAKNYKEQTLGKLNLIKLVNTEKFLLISIDECRKLLEKLPRGTNTAVIRTAIQEKLDNARSSLNNQNDDIKTLIISANEILVQLRWQDDSIIQEKVEELHSKLHDAKDLCSEKILSLR